MPHQRTERAARLLRNMLDLAGDLKKYEEEYQHHGASCDPSHVLSVENLSHYLALRKHDMRSMQEELTSLGLSSLGRAEAHVAASVEAVLHALHFISRQPGEPPATLGSKADFAHGQRRLKHNTVELLGVGPSHRQVRIMVTMPSEAANDYGMIKEMLLNGMNCMRINCAHDGPAEWSRMAAHLRKAVEETGIACKVMMDLGGPKLRTGPVHPGPAVLKWRPSRDEFGRVIRPARIWLYPQDAPISAPSDADALLPVPDAWIRSLQVDDTIGFTDTRGSHRTLRVTEEIGGARWAESGNTAYLSADTELTITNKPDAATTQVGALRSSPGLVSLKKGEWLVLTRLEEPGSSARVDGSGAVLELAHIGCEPPEVFQMVKAGEPIAFDDGKIGGMIEQVFPDRIHVRITQTRPGGSKLGADKGINLPQSELTLPALTEQDLKDLPHIVKLADLVALSFVQRAEDVHQLESRLRELNGGHLGIVLKIETRRSFENLPELLLAALRWPRAGVMIARGDLAVECGFERLAEVQEEILWICEAAHMPVIWATQVLETLAKKGQPSRAEITDAAMGVRAECVMLNKGPHIIEAMLALDSILQRMQTHQSKKSALLRNLKAWS